MIDIFKLQEEAAAKVSEIMARPIQESADFKTADDFDPWAIFPALYGSYCSDFDKCAIDVLTGLLDLNPRRKDLAADMLREMLCVADLCDYGTSPRTCFPTSEFRKLLPELIEKWRAYAVIAWGDCWDQD
jgi:hypothetical protein